MQLSKAPYLQKRRSTRAITYSVHSLRNAKPRRICSVQECFVRVRQNPEPAQTGCGSLQEQGKLFRVLNRCPRNEDSRPTLVTHKLCWRSEEGSSNLVTSAALLHLRLHSSTVRHRHSIWVNVLAGEAPRALAHATQKCSDTLGMSDWAVFVAHEQSA